MFNYYKKPRKKSIFITKTSKLAYYNELLTLFASKLGYFLVNLLAL